MYTEYGKRRNDERDAMMANRRITVSHLQRQNQHPFEPAESHNYPSVTTQRIPRPSTGKHVKLKSSVRDAGSNVPPCDYNNYYSAQQPRSQPKPLDYRRQLLNNHAGPTGILKHNNSSTSNSNYSKRRPLAYELKPYEYFNNATRNSNSIQPTSTKNTNSLLQQHYSGQNYNINYNLNFTKNQYNILISPPTTTTTPGLVPRTVPSYDENNHFDNHYQYHYQNNGRNYKNNNISADHHRYSYNQYLDHQEQLQHSTKSFYLDEKPPFGVGDITSPLDGGGKMQREEIIIEHSQLVGDGSGPGAVIISAGGPAGQDQRAGQQPLLHGGKGGGKLTAINRSHHFTQIIAALAVSIGPLAAGLGKGYSSPAIASLQEVHLRQRGNYTAFSVDDQQASWIASLSLLGALFGGMFGGVAMQYGRKRVLTLMALPFSLSWILTVFAKSVETMFFTAFVGGFCCAIVSTVTQVYISEISSPDIRGFLSAIQKIAGHLGMLISYLLGAYLDWRQLAMLVSVAPIMLFISVIYIPETPSFLVLRGCDEEAHRSLQWLRGPHKNVEIELDTIRSNVRTSRMNLLNRMSSMSATATSTGQPLPTHHQPPSSYLPEVLRSWQLPRISFDAVATNVKAVMRNARLVKPVSITCGLMIFQRFTGANSFNFYAVSIFSKTFAGMNPHGAAIAVGFVQLLASMLSGLLIDTVGRIPLLIVSSVFMSLALASFGSFVYYGQTNKLIATANFDLDEPVGNNDWIPLLCVLVFTVAFSLGISPISWLLVGELFPLEYRGIGSSIATSFSYFCAFLGVKTFMDFQALFGLHGTFWLYACISCAGLFFVIMVVPETKGRDLEEMDPKYVRTLTINR
ncbi:facilitated trehalose transporter Tret1-like isoform X2 [Malaya genurostris]|uniref:facilitated trehalose transporter Tret1-like isoform X2 n=1 Tax=Malaya genurostris TaxID=325434 RepID=UPI0026F3CC7B|nr:facilitated trehalose transporter Tret1-like isoform X2 [Malaya genurostris]XP_058452799.1 facilitated trehalose transporter Tret1-like isoform X2 [Malaya genurostris]